MRSRTLPLSLTLLLVASVAMADYGSPPPPPPSPSSTRMPGGSPSEDEAASARRSAEKYFADAYGDVVKGGKEADKGKKDNADKRYRRALERSRMAVQLDSTYFEAWNLIGFTSRKLGDYPNSFSAYRVALRLKPDFALAHEYYGEGLLETGDLEGARAQLEALRTNGTPEQIAQLETAVAKFVASHPTSVTGATAPADSSSTAGPGK
jgi:tetratricopeptide (TPR) repeat protein